MFIIALQHQQTSRDQQLLAGFPFKFLPESQALKCHFGVVPIASICETEDPVDIVGAAVFVPETISIKQHDLSVGHAADCICSCSPHHPSTDDANIGFYLQDLNPKMTLCWERSFARSLSFQTRTMPSQLFLLERLELRVIHMFSGYE